MLQGDDKMNLLKRLFDHEYKELKRFSEIADKIDALDEEYTKLSDYELKSKTDEFRKRLKSGETLDDILVEAFATARETILCSTFRWYFYTFWKYI